MNKSGAWLAYEGEKIGQGRENAKKYLAEHPELLETLDQKIREHYHFGPDGQEEKNEDAEK